MYVKTDADGRISATWKNLQYGIGDLEFDFPADFDFMWQRDWRLEDGALVYDPLPEASPMPTPMEVLRSQLDDVILAMADMIGGAL